MEDEEEKKKHYEAVLDHTLHEFVFSLLCFDVVETGQQTNVQ